MLETGAHLKDHVSSRLSVRHWVLSVPKRLRYYMQRDGAVLNMVLRIFLRVTAQSLQDRCAGAAQVDRAALRITAVSLIHRFGSSLNGHVHFHVCVVDGVFEEVAGQGDTDAQFSPPGIVFHPASAIDEAAVAPLQTDFSRRILRAFVGRGLLESLEAKETLGYQHRGFPVDAGVCIKAHDRATLERLLRCCARPLLVNAFAKRAPPWFTGHKAGQASQHEQGRTWRGAAGPCESTHGRTRASQTFTGA